MPQHKGQRKHKIARPAFEEQFARQDAETDPPTTNRKPICRRASDIAILTAASEKGNHLSGRLIPGKEAPENGKKYRF